MKIVLWVSVLPETPSVSLISSRYSPTGKLASGMTILPGSWWPAAMSNWGGSVDAFSNCGAVLLKSVSPSAVFW